MKLIAATTLLSLLPAMEAFAPSSVSKQATKLSSSTSAEDTSSDDTSSDKAMDELIAIAKAANPIVKYYDPLDLVNQENMIGGNKAQTIGWLRHAEIKHGRVAMAAFVGYCLQANGNVFSFASELGINSDVVSPEAQWDAMDTSWKYYILLLVGISELIDEGDDVHYMNGREPGRHRLFQQNTKKTPEKLADGRIKELNNGRLAMLGIMGFVSHSSIPGSVPLLGLTKLVPYEGNFWAPFQADFSLLEAASTAATAAS